MPVDLKTLPVQPAEGQDREVYRESPVRRGVDLSLLPSQPQDEQTFDIRDPRSPEYDPEKYASELGAGINATMKSAFPLLWTEAALSGPMVAFQEGKPLNEVIKAVPQNMRTYAQSVMQELALARGENIPLEDRVAAKTFSDVWGNYYQAVTGEEAPGWYRTGAGMASLVGMSLTSASFRRFIQNTAKKTGATAKEIASGVKAHKQLIAQLKGEQKEFIDWAMTRGLSRPDAVKMARSLTREILRPQAMGGKITDTALAKLFAGQVRPAAVGEATKTAGQMVDDILKTTTTGAQLPTDVQQGLPALVSKQHARDLQDVLNIFNKILSRGQVAGAAARSPITGESIDVFRPTFSIGAEEEGEGRKSYPEFLKQQDENQEKIVHGFTEGFPIEEGGWDKGAVYRHNLEGSGDIYREVTKSKPDAGYINEKLERLDRWFAQRERQSTVWKDKRARQLEKQYGVDPRKTKIHPQDSFEYAKQENPEKFELLKKQWKEQPAETELQKIAKDLNIALINGNFETASQKISAIREQLTEQANEEGVAETQETKPENPAEKMLQAEDLDMGPPSKDFPGVEQSFLDLPKKRSLRPVQYLTPADFQLRKYGFDAYIGQNAREAMRGFNLEYSEKLDEMIRRQLQVYEGKTDEEKAKSLAKLKKFLTKEMPAETDRSIEAETARWYRQETLDIRERINKVREKLGLKPIGFVENYVYRLLLEEIRREWVENGKLSNAIKKTLSDDFPTLEMFLKTAVERKNAPEEWFNDNVFEAMRAMYAADLKFIYLQDALAEINPYLTAVKQYEEDGGWHPSVFEYLTSWVNHGLMRKPSKADADIDEVVDLIFSGALNQINALKASNLRKQGLTEKEIQEKLGTMVRPSWPTIQRFLSGAVHAGALSLRTKALIRNLQQSTHDYILWGSKAYKKAFKMRFTQEGHDILMQSKLYRTRMPIEAQDLQQVQKIIKSASVPYRWSDIVNVRQSILTTYWHARDTLNYSHEQAVQFAEDHVPDAQWSYEQENMPKAYWSSAGKFAWQLGSWWMNQYFRFFPEILMRTFKGEIYDPITPKTFSGEGGEPVPTGGVRKATPEERRAGLRFLLVLGITYAIGKGTKELFGVTIDFTRNMLSVPSMSPHAQTLQGLLEFSTGLIAGNPSKTGQGFYKMTSASGLYIPGKLGLEDIYDATVKGEVLDLFFYTKREDKPKKQYLR